jgi:hypothetical protein
MSANPIDRSFLRMALGHPAFVTGFVLSAFFVILGACLLCLDAVRSDQARHRIEAPERHRFSIGLERIISAAICFP